MVPCIGLTALCILNLLEIKLFSCFNINKLMQLKLLIFERRRGFETIPLTDTRIEKRLFQKRNFVLVYYSFIPLYQKTILQITD